MSKEGYGGGSGSGFGFGLGDDLGDGESFSEGFGDGLGDGLGKGFGFGLVRGGGTGFGYVYGCFGYSRGNGLGYGSKDITTVACPECEGNEFLFYSFPCFVCEKCAVRFLSSNFIRSNMEEKKCQKA